MLVNILVSLIKEFYLNFILHLLSININIFSYIFIDLYTYLSHFLYLNNYYNYTVQRHEQRCCCWNGTTVYRRNKYY